MKFSRLLHVFNFLMLSALLCGCCRSNEEVWDDTKSCSRHMGRGFSTLSGKQGDSRAVNCRDDFYCADFGDGQDDFISIEDENNFGDLNLAERSFAQPTQSPGDPGSTIPGIESFRDPGTDTKLSGVFRNVQFDYNQYLIKGDYNTSTIRGIAEYMRSNPNAYIFVEGHCDEKGPEAYNLALGSRRANAVRNMLIQEGINGDRIFTISYGKERPLVLDHHEEAWAMNRRAEFKVYHR